MQGLQWLERGFVSSISQKTRMTLPKKINVENEAADNKQLTFRFYEVMNYPLPLEKDFFAYRSKRKV